MLGSVEMEVRYKDQRAKLPLLIVKGAGPSLLGRNWLGSLKLHWNEIHCMHSGGLQQILLKYDSVFQDGLGTLGTQGHYIR